MATAKPIRPKAEEPPVIVMQRGPRPPHRKQVVIGKWDFVKKAMGRMKEKDWFIVPGTDHLDKTQSQKLVWLLRRHCGAGGLKHISVAVGADNVGVIVSYPGTGLVE